VGEDEESIQNNWMISPAAVLCNLRFWIAMIRLHATNAALMWHAYGACLTVLTEGAR
jgi:hypothetical protein